MSRTLIPAKYTKFPRTAKVNSRAIFHIHSFAKVNYREIFCIDSFAKVNSHETQKYREFFASRKFLLAKVSSFKVHTPISIFCTLQNRSNYLFLFYGYTRKVMTKNKITSTNKIKSRWSDSIKWAKSQTGLFPKTN